MIFSHIKHEQYALLQLLQCTHIYCDAAFRPDAALPMEIAMFLSYLMSAYRRVMLYRKTLAELSRLDDRDLQDLGISRCDIHHVAQEASLAAE